LAISLALWTVALSIGIGSIWAVLGARGSWAQEPEPEPPTVTIEPAARDTLPLEPLPEDPDALIASLEKRRAELPPDSPRLEQLGALIEAAGEWRELRAAQQAIRAELEQEPTTRPAELPSELPAILALRELEERRASRRRSAATLKQALESSERALAAARDDLEERDRIRRDARTAALAGVANGQMVSLDAFEARRLESKLASERVALRQLEVERAQARIRENAQLAVGLEARTLETRRQLAVQGAPADLEAAFAPRIDELARRQAAVELAREQAQRRLNEARRRRPNPRTPVEVEQLESLSIDLEGRVQEGELVSRQQARVEQERGLLALWESLLRQQLSRDELRKQEAELERQDEETHQAELLSQVRLEELRERRAELARRVDALAGDDPLRRIFGTRDDGLGRVSSAQTAAQAEVERTRRLIGWVRADISDALGRPSFGERWSDFVRVVRELWTYEIMVIDDDAITVGSALLALVLLVAGFTLSRRASRALGRLAAERFSVEAGAAAALETFGFYVLLIAFTLFALRTVNFPLTVFTLAGGALAIGIGFGSQNVMNNFISGLILMLERPIRARDLVEIDGTYGTIESIGARSTIIRASDSTQLIVPNSFFLENRIVNWTLSDDVVRSRIVVGVAYGSPTRRVETLIREALNRHPKILSKPEPVILFSEFGDNSLNFEAFFWMRARSPMAVRRVESDVRFSIDDVFREADVVIAFPQRDVHLDSARPIEVRLQPAAPVAPAARIEQEPEEP